jgi:RNA polymerase sigma factor (sigma-70 family)
LISETDTITFSATQTFADIVNSKQGMVYNTALGILQNESDAEDITQEVFIKVFEQLKNFRGDAALTTWIYRITVNTALDHDKNLKREKRGGLLKRVFGKDANEDVPHFDHPGVALDKKEDAKVLFAAINKLPNNQRAAFLLNKLEGLTNKEIAAVLKITLQAAESLQVRAKSNLKTALKDYYEKHF